jgi:hypothetical protein
MCLSVACFGTPPTQGDGLAAKAVTVGNLDPFSLSRHFSSTWTVTKGDETVGKGFADVKFLGDGHFAAKSSPFDNDDYSVYDSSGGTVTSNQYRYIESLGGGYSAVPSSNGIGMMDVLDKNLKVVGSYPSYAKAEYAGGGKLRVTANGNDEFKQLQGSTNNNSSARSPRPTSTPQGDPRAGIFVDIPIDPGVIRRKDK